MNSNFLVISDGFSLSLSLSRFVEVSLRFHCCCHSLLCKSLKVKHSFAYSRKKKKLSYFRFVFLSFTFLFVHVRTKKELELFPPHHTSAREYVGKLATLFFLFFVSFFWLWIRFFCVYVIDVCLYFINCPQPFCLWKCLRHKQTTTTMAMMTVTTTANTSTITTAIAQRAHTQKIFAIK